jgi:N-acetylglucosamine malate deacetylase 1
MVDILAITAHPDDLEAGAAGFMIKAKSKGLKTGLIILTRGGAGKNGNAETRDKEAKKAVEILKIDEFIHLDFPDAGIQNNKETLDIIVPLIRKASPDIILTIHADDYHPDHCAVSKLVDKAVFVAGLRGSSDDDSTWHPKNTFYFCINSKYFNKKPDFILDISDVWETKKKAVLAHASQPILEMIENQSKFFGMIHDVKYGEGYFSKYPFLMNDISCLF